RAAGHGPREAAGFAVHHRVLSHGHWCSRAVAHRPLLLLVAAFVPDGPVVIGIDDTVDQALRPQGLGPGARRGGRLQEGPGRGRPQARRDLLDNVAKSAVGFVYTV